jgi:thymidylate synthase ThyX
LTISAKVIAHSESQTSGKTIATLQLRYPRFIHAEFMTHRMFSRNASSSRAIPVERLIKDILEDTAMPIHWGKNQKGMQADHECNEVMRFGAYKPQVGLRRDGEIDIVEDGPEYQLTREKTWFEARDMAIAYAMAMTQAGYHKQIVNRLLEPFSHINVLVTATEWSNFFALRIHPDAQPEIHELAKKMKEALDNFVPIELGPQEWHLPYVTDEDWVTTSGMNFYEQNKTLIKLSVARCARVSYLTQEGKKPSLEQDLQLYDRLIASVPLHASPAEHQATPICDNSLYIDCRDHWSGNFFGWLQYRKMLPGECQ